MLAAAAAALLLAATPALAQVKVGSKNFTEQFIVAELYAQALEAAGIKVERKINLGGTLIAHKALEEKQIDLYPEYTGTMLLAVLKAEPMTDRKAVYDKVKTEYAAKGLVVLNEAMNNGYDMVVRPETAAQYKLETLSDLAKVSKELKLGAGPEFRDRKDGLPGLKAKYGMEFKEDLQLAIGLRYQALANKQIDVVNGYSTDGMISAMKLKRLKDDKGLWPPYFLVPGRAQGRARRESEDRRRPEPGERAADRSEHGGDELQGRRREDGAEGRRARFPEIQGHRQVEPRATRRPAMRTVTLGTARVGIADVVAVARDGAAVDVARRRHRTARALSRGRRPCGDRRRRRSTGSIPLSAPTPALRSPPTSSSATRCTRCARAPSASDRRCRTTAFAPRCSRARPAWRRAARGSPLPSSGRSSPR